MQTHIKIAKTILILFLLAVVILKGVLPGWKNIHSDFANYYVSSKLLIDKEPITNIYDNEWFQEKIKSYGINTQGKFAPFPPLTALIMIPLTKFEPLTAQRIFILVNLLFMGVGVLIIHSLTGWTKDNCLLIILASGLGLINNIAFGQVYWILVVGILFSIQWEEKNRLIISSILLALFSALKYLPVMFIGGYLLNSFVGQQKEIALKENRGLKIFLYSSFAIILLVTFQVFFFGSYVFSEFIQSSFLPHLNGELKGQGLYSYQFQSWDVFLRKLFVADPQFNPSPLMDWPNGKHLGKILILVATGLSTLMVIWKYRDASNATRQSIYLSIPVLASFTVLPASATYHFILLLPPILLLLRSGILNKYTRTGILVIYFLIGFIPYSLFYKLSNAWGVLFSFPRLWMINILFLVTILDLLIYKKEHSNLESSN